MSQKDTAKRYKDPLFAVFSSMGYLFLANYLRLACFGVIAFGVKYHQITHLKKINMTTGNSLYNTVLQGAYLEGQIIKRNRRKSFEL